MKYIDLCPKCGGRLTMTGEQNCRPDDEAMDLTASPAAAEPVTLECTKCGYTLETDSETARDAEALGLVHERLCAFQDLTLTSVPDELSALYPMEQRNVYKFYGAIHRDAEREKIGLDMAAMKTQLDQIKEECKVQLQDLEVKQGQCEDRCSACLQQLDELSFFHFIKRFSLKRTLAELKKEELDLSDQVDACNRDCQQKIDDIITKTVDRCRLLAVAYMEKYAPKEYREVLYILYSLLDSKPMKAQELAETYPQRLNGMTPSQITAVFNSFTNPFVSKASMSDDFYFGPERKGPRSYILERMVEPEQLEPLERVAQELYGDDFRPYHTA